MNKWITRIDHVHRLLLAGLLFLALAVAPRPAAAVEPVTIGAQRVLALALITLAEDQGFFARQGLEVTVKGYAIGKQAFQAMLAGEIDLATPAETPVVFTSFTRTDFRVVATLASSDKDQIIIARQDKGILRPADLKGKRLAVMEGTSDHYYLHLFLLRHGMTEKDVALSFRPPDELIPALERGEIDAYSVRERRLGEEKLLGGKVIRFQEPGIYHKWYTLAASAALIKNRPQVIRGVLQALIMAEEFVAEYPARAVEILARRLAIPTAEVAAGLHDISLRVSLEQALIVSLENEARWALRNRLTDKTAVPDYLDFLYLEALGAVRSERVTVIR